MEPFDDPGDALSTTDTRGYQTVTLLQPIEIMQDMDWQFTAFTTLVPYTPFTLPTNLHLQKLGGVGVVI